MRPSSQHVLQGVVGNWEGLEACPAGRTLLVGEIWDALAAERVAASQGHGSPIRV